MCLLRALLCHIGLHTSFLCVAPSSRRLQVVSEVVDEWLAVQRNWLYLQPIFDSEDINKQLPAEGKRFASVDKHWRATMASAGGGAL